MGANSGLTRRGFGLIAVAATAVITLGAIVGLWRYWRSSSEDASPLDESWDSKKRRRSNKDLSDTPKRQRQTGSPKLPQAGIVDIRASWAAKHMVTDADQGDSKKLGKVYEQMAAALQEQGLNLAAIQAQRQYYGGLEVGQKAFPLRYQNFPVPLEQGAVRLAVFLLGDSAPLQGLVTQATHDVMAVLPQDMRPCEVDEDDYHMTVFMTSQPSDPRPDPFVQGGGINRSEPLSVIPAPDKPTLRKELDAWRELADSTVAPRFQVHSIVFASSGTLLLCFVDTSGRLLALRQSARAAFPGAAAKQSSIMHMTMGRVLDGREMTPGEIDAVQERCKHWTGVLQGQPFSPLYLWWAQEYTFTTVQGKREPLLLQKEVLSADKL